MRDFNQVFKRLSVENERSALAVLTGMHNSIVSKLWIIGNVSQTHAAKPAAAVFGIKQPPADSEKLMIWPLIIKLLKMIILIIESFAIGDRLMRCGNIMPNKSGQLGAYSA